MRVVERVEELRGLCDAERAGGSVVGFVPTMGSFHDGHRSLLRAARRDTDVVVASIFVNPLQFAPGEDLSTYPRSLEADTAMATDDGVDILFVPPPPEMYPVEPVTAVHVSTLTDRLCGASRPTFFDGVATVVTKLFAIVGRCRAYFGRKDFQQLAVVRRLTADLNLPVDVVGCPLVRDVDGLALSSRNAYLRADERWRATVLYRSLLSVTDDIVAGERDATVVRDRLGRLIAGEPRAELDYAAVVDTDTLEPIDRIAGNVLIACAAQLGGARLLDNMTVDLRGSDVVVDAGTLTVGV
ncbi:MAG: pantoate--beta-alanine ligase [Acidimicrobiia bacterium]